MALVERFAQVESRANNEKRAEKTRFDAARGALGDARDLSGC